MWWTNVFVRSSEDHHHLFILGQFTGVSKALHLRSYWPSNSKKEAGRGQTPAGSKSPELPYYRIARSISLPALSSRFPSRYCHPDDNFSFFYLLNIFWFIYFKSNSSLRCFNSVEQFLFFYCVREYHQFI